MYPWLDSVSSLDDIDQLPLPPPDMCYSSTPPIQGYMHRTNLQSAPTLFTESNHYHVSPVTSPNVQSKPFPPGDQQTGSHPITRLPPPCPSTISTLKKSGTLQKSSRRISFDDNVQMIDAPPS